MTSAFTRIEEVNKRPGGDQAKGLGGGLAWVSSPLRSSGASRANYCGEAGGASGFGVKSWRFAAGASRWLSANGVPEAQQRSPLRFPGVSSRTAYRSAPVMEAGEERERRETPGNLSIGEPLPR